MPDWISADQAASEFKRSRKWIFTMMRLGKLTRYRSEGDQRTLVDRDEIRKLVEPKPQE